MAEVLNFFINPGQQFPQKAEYVFHVLFSIIGFRSRQVFDEDSAHVVYTLEDAGGENKLWIKATHTQNWDLKIPYVEWQDELPVLFLETQKPAINLNRIGRIEFDLIFSTYCILCGVFEKEQAKDPWQVPVFKNSFYQQVGLLEKPVVAIYADFLYRKITEVFNRFSERVPLWPHGKKFCIALTHDVDYPFDLNNKFVFNFKKVFHHPTLRNFKNLAGSLSRNYLNDYFSSYRETDPNFCFYKWMEFEKKLNAHSGFYVAVRNLFEKGASPQDVSYHFNHPLMVKAMRTAIEKGWEIGLHASINAKTAYKKLAEEKLLLESKLGGYKISGMRHHFWSLNGNFPEETLAMHGQAGFEYDSSLGINDVTGFRRGIIYPFFPFHRVKNEMISVLQIPPTLMDGAIFYDNNITSENGTMKIRQHIEMIKKYNGAAVLDWHLEQFNFSRLNGAGQSLTTVLMELAGDQEIFWASPIQLHDWWRKREHYLSVN